ncbi:MAG TPA: hypothetical protein ENO08_04230, partial [Candidatus Eisenbacteria bacterium]|nr:hypothetical protein [Candidatus Eisenbacteria bacterium]
MHRARGVTVIACLFVLIAYAGLSSQEPPEFTARVPFPPGVALTSPGGVDTLLVDPGTIGVPLEVLVTDLLGSPVTNLVGDPIEVPVDFTIIKTPSGAAGAGFQPGGLDSMRVLTDMGGFAGVSFDVGDLPGVYQVEASSPYGDFNYVFTMLTTGFTASITVVPHMPSAPVDTLGGIMVDIFPFDRSGTPMLDADLVVTLRQGPDGKWSYPVTNMGGGLYQATVPSAIADAGIIIATDTASYARGYTEVEYLKDIGDGLYFDTSDVQFMPVWEGEDQYYVVGAYLRDRFGNKFFEGEASYTGMVLGEPPIAIVDSTWFENDYFMSRIRSIDVG